MVITEAAQRLGVKILREFPAQTVDLMVETAELIAMEAARGVLEDEATTVAETSGGWMVTSDREAILIAPDGGVQTIEDESEDEDDDEALDEASMTYKKLMQALKDGKAEVDSWEGRGQGDTRRALVVFYKNTGDRGTRKTIEVTGIPADMQESLEDAEAEVLDEAFKPEPPNKEDPYGFWGTLKTNSMTDPDVDGSQAFGDREALQLWDYASKEIGAQTKASPEKVKEFLRSRFGRHFADEVFNQMFDSGPYHKSPGKQNLEKLFTVKNAQAAIKQIVRKEWKRWERTFKSATESTEALDDGSLCEGSNLGKSGDSLNYKVIKSFPAYVKVGHEKSNASYGSANVLRPIWKKITVKPGDEIGSWFGGTYLNSKDGQYKKAEIAMEEPEFAPFERGSEKFQKFPMEKLKLVEESVDTVSTLDEGAGESAVDKAVAALFRNYAVADIHVAISNLVDAGGGLGKRVELLLKRVRHIRESLDEGALDTRFALDPREYDKWKAEFKKVTPNLRYEIQFAKSTSGKAFAWGSTTGVEWLKLTAKDKGLKLKKVPFKKLVDAMNEDDLEEGKVPDGYKKIRPTKLKKFNKAMTKAVLSKDGQEYDAVKIGKSWYLTGDYAYESEGGQEMYEKLIEAIVYAVPVELLREFDEAEDKRVPFAKIVDSVSDILDREVEAEKAEAARESEDLDTWLEQFVDGDLQEAREALERQALAEFAHGDYDGALHGKRLYTVGILSGLEPEQSMAVAEALTLRFQSSAARGELNDLLPESVRGLSDEALAESLQEMGPLGDHDIPFNAKNPYDTGPGTTAKGKPEFSDEPGYHEKLKSLLDSEDPLQAVLDYAKSVGVTEDEAALAVAEAASKTGNPELKDDPDNLKKVAHKGGFAKTLGKLVGKLLGLGESEELDERRARKMKSGQKLSMLRSRKTQTADEKKRNRSRRKWYKQNKAKVKRARKRITASVNNGEDYEAVIEAPEVVLAAMEEVLCDHELALVYTMDDAGLHIPENVADELLAWFESEDDLDEAELDEKTLSAADRAKLQDSAFAYIDDKGERHYPIHDEAHVKAAIAYAKKNQNEVAKAAWPKIVKAAKKFGIDAGSLSEADLDEAKKVKCECDECGYEAIAAPGSDCPECEDGTMEPMGESDDDDEDMDESLDEGKNKRGKRDGTGPFKGSTEFQSGGKGKRKDKDGKCAMESVRFPHTADMVVKFVEASEKAGLPETTQVIRDDQGYRAEFPAEFAQAMQDAFAGEGISYGG